MRKFINIKSLLYTYLIMFSDHARSEMENSRISKAEVENCLCFGNLVIKQFVNNAVRYGKQITFKDKTIVVIYIYRNNEERIITAYLIKRKKMKNYLFQMSKMEIFEHTKIQEVFDVSKSRGF